MPESHLNAALDGHRMGQRSSGCTAVDKILGGGIETDCITSIYGPAGAGKTNLALLAAITTVKAGKKVIYVDTEGGVSVPRLEQLADKDTLQKILFLQPTTFKEQCAMIAKLSLADVGLIVVDSISMLYRLELGENFSDTNRELGKQLAALTAITRKRQIPILLTNQVYSAFDERDKVRMVGGDLLQYGSKCIIELQITPNNLRRAVLRKHRSPPPDVHALFKITQKGCEEAKERFSLF